MTIVGILDVGQINPAEKTKGNELSKTIRVANSLRGINNPRIIPKKMADNKKGMGF